MGLLVSVSENWKQLIIYFIFNTEDKTPVFTLSFFFINNIGSLKKQKTTKYNVFKLVILITHEGLQF